MIIWWPVCRDSIKKAHGLQKQLNRIAFIQAKFTLFVCNDSRRYTFFIVQAHCSRVKWTAFHSYHTVLEHAIFYPEDCCWQTRLLLVRCQIHLNYSSLPLVGRQSRFFIHTHHIFFSVFFNFGLLHVIADRIYRTRYFAPGFLLFLIATLFANLDIKMALFSSNISRII